VQRPVGPPIICVVPSSPAKHVFEAPFSAKALRATPGSATLRLELAPDDSSTTTRDAILCAAMLTRIDHVAIGAADLRAGIAAYRRIGFELDERGVARNDGDRLELVTPGDGLQSIALASDDLAADSKAVQARETSTTSSSLRKRQRPAAGPASQRRAAHRAVYIAVKDVAWSAALYARLLACRRPSWSAAPSSTPTWRYSSSARPALGLAQPAGPRRRRRRSPEP